MNTSPPFRLIVFDLDGTLVDSRRDLAESANAVLEASGRPPHPEALIGRMVGDGAATLIARAFDASGCPAPDDALAMFLSVYNSRLLTHTRPYEGIPELLRTLERRSTLAVLTNKPLAATLTILDAFGLTSFFTGGVIGGDGLLPRKPDPAGLSHLIAAASTSPGETLLVGDSIIDWRTAKAGGTHCCLAGYGFGFEGFPPGHLTPDDCIIDRPLGLLDLL